MPRVLNHLTVVRDGMHNAFTTMVYWKDAYWIAYRKGQGHSDPTGQVAISKSHDRAQWREAAKLNIPGDNRDPLFVTINENRLALLFPNVPESHKPHETMPLSEQWITFSSDGIHWETPRRILEPRHHLFHVRKHNGVYYGLDCWRDKKRRLLLWTSTDLIQWERVCQIGGDNDGMNESDIVFRPGGEAWVLSRTEGESRKAMFSSAKPPYTDWKTQSLGIRIQAPHIFEYGGHVYIAGRSVPRLIGEPTWPFGQSLYIWELTRGQVKAILRLPTAGDSTYPGVVVDAEDRLCLSYYSQHAYCFGVLPPFNPEVADLPQNARVADIYFAEIVLP